MGRLALPHRLCQHACISRLRPARPHRLGGDAVFSACSVEICRTLAGAEPQERAGIWFESRWSVAVKVHSRHPARCVSGICVKPALAPRSRAACEQTGAARMAPGALAGRRPQSQAAPAEGDSPAGAGAGVDSAEAGVTLAALVAAAATPAAADTGSLLPTKHHHRFSVVVCDPQG